MIRTLLMSTALSALLAGAALAQQIPAGAGGTAAAPAQSAGAAQPYQPQATDVLASDLIGMTVYSTLSGDSSDAGNSGGVAGGAASGTTAGNAPSIAPSSGTGGAVTPGVAGNAAPSASGIPATPGAGSGAGPTIAGDSSVGGAGAGASSSADPTEGREAIGDIGDLLLDANGQVRAVLIGVGGFLGIGERDIAIDFGQLRWVAGENGDQVLTMNTTRELLEAAPAFDRDQIGQAVNEGGAATGAPRPASVTR